ncbi:MAG: lipase [Clostridiaceae bacterium]|nr:lipase [Clostridiaceae bacterium]
MKIRRVTGFVMAFVMLVSSFTGVAFAADNRWEPKNSEPFIFVHGLNGWGGAEDINGIMPYWGATTGNLMQYLEHEGYECYSASVGPMSSAWDRACELYAQLMGTTVDYGIAHSKEYNHKRYGRTYYQPLIPNWGELDAEGKIQQVHLIGHSFGGTTIRVLIQLLTEGSAEERAVTPADDISGLFTGGKDGWVKSATTICTPHNSSSIYYPLVMLGLDRIVQFFSFLYAGVMGRSSLNGGLVDFHLEQFGLTEIPGIENSADNFFEALALILDNKEDSCQYDLTPEGNEKLNAKLSINENIYYFSYAFSTTKEVPLTGTQVPIITTNPVLAPMAFLIGVMQFTDPVNGTVYDTDWLANDAMVNTESAKHPKNEPYKDFDAADIQPGVWNVMPVQQGDHGTAIGLFADKDKTHEFYLGLCEMLTELP